MKELSEKHIKSRAIKILTLLKRFYSLRELQETLGIPFQALWRYVNLSSYPEQETAEKILKKVNENKLIERALDKLLKEIEKDPLLLISRPSFISLYSFLVVSEIGKEKVDIVVPLSVASIPHATTIALELGCPICPVLKEYPLLERGIITFQVNNIARKTLEIYGIPKNCLKQRPKILLIDLFIYDLPKLESFIKEVVEGRASIVKVFALKMSDSAKDFLKRNSIDFKEIVDAKGSNFYIDVNFKLNTR